MKKKSVTDRVPGWNEEVVAVVAEPQIGDAVGGRRRQLPPWACGCGGCGIPSSSYHTKVQHSSFLSSRMRLRNTYLWSGGGEAEGNDRFEAGRKSKDATTKKKEEESTRARRRVGEAKYSKIQEAGPGLPFVSWAGI